MSTGLTNPIKLPHMMRALRSQNYRYFFVGYGISQIGIWMQNLALNWLVYRLTGDEFMLGLLNFAGQFPILILTPIMGVIADRWNRRKLLILTQTLELIQAAVLATMVLSGFINKTEEAWYLIGMNLTLGIINSLDIPVRQSFVADMVYSLDDLGSAVPLNQLLMSGTRILGSFIAGYVVTIWGEGMCFFFNSATVLAIIAAVLAMKITPRARPKNRRHILHELNEGIRYCWRNPPIRLVLFFLTLMSLAGIPYSILMPVFAKSVFLGGSELHGYLIGSLAVGAVCGTIFLASRHNPRNLGRIIGISAILFGGAITLFSFSDRIWDWLALFLLGRASDTLSPNWVLWIAGPALAASGFGQVGLWMSGNILLQTIVEEDKRGRIMGIFMMVYVGVSPIASLMGGFIARHMGPVPTVLAGGLLCLIIAAVLYPRLSRLRFSVQNGASSV
jgi:MFS family permease